MTPAANFNEHMASAGANDEPSVTVKGEGSQAIQGQLLSRSPLAIEGAIRHS